MNGCYVQCGLLLVVLAFHFCECMRLETNSILYGVGLIAAKKGESSPCHLQLANVSSAIDRRERWAIKVLDASGVPSGGLHWGNTFWLGSRDQCLSAGRTAYLHLNPTPAALAAERGAVLPFPVDYYVAYLRHDSELQLSVNWLNETKVSLGLCLPSACSGDEVSQLLQEYFSSNVLYQQHVYNMSLEVLEIKKTENHFSIFDSSISVIFTIVTAILIILVVVGTWYDVRHTQSIQNKKHIVTYEINGNIEDKYFKVDAYDKNGQNGCSNGYSVPDNSKKPKADFNTLEKIVLSFSWYTNARSVLSLVPKSGTLLPICGLRMYTTSFVIVSHSFLFALDYCDNKVYAFNITDTYFGQFFLNSSFSTDAFFCISGFLMAHGFFKSRHNEDPPQLSNWSNFKSYLNAVLRRFLRITPSYMYTLGLTFILAASTYGTSSLWINERNDLVCPRFWWTNLLFINNIYPGRTMCMTWSYYLANEMQFFVVISLICHLSKKYFKAAALLLATVFAASTACIAIATYVTAYKPYAVSFFLMIETFYYPPWMRIGPYIVGTCYGYLYQRLNGKLEMKKMYISGIWILMISIGVYLEFCYKERNLPMLTSVLYMSFSRSLWALMVGWIILACLTGHGGPLNSILSFSLWVPLSQLTYWAYLINPIITYTVASFNEKSWQLAISNVTLSSAGLVLLTFILSIVMVLSIEVPFEKIVNILFNNKKSSSEVHKNVISAEMEAEHKKIK